MSKKSVKQKIEKATEVVEKQAEKISVPSSDGMLFHKENYMLMGIGLVCILVGFALMAGGKSPDPNIFDKEAIYSFRRITLAPVLVLIGFAIEAYAILKKPKQA